MTRTQSREPSGLRNGPHREQEWNQISRMLELEEQILATIDPVSKLLEEHPESVALLARLRATAEDHAEGLRVRMLGIHVGELKSMSPGGFATVIPRAVDPQTAPSSALQVLYALVSHAAFGYGVLHVVAHRECDSAWAIEQGNTADLAEEHLKDYAQVVEIMYVLSSDVAVWELSRNGLECRCVCPSCGLGICMCGSHGVATVIEAMRGRLSSRKDPSDEGLSLLSPARSGSVAMRAGMDRGDAIVGIDDQPVGRNPDLAASITEYQKALRQHGPGDELLLKVRRRSGAVESVHVANVRPEPAPEERRLAAIMFTDLVGFTALAQKDEPRALRLLEDHRTLVRSTLARHRGREIKTMGDAFLVEFSSALEAANCALEIQGAIRRRNQDRRADRIRLRIGIHVGDLVSIGGDIFGDAVNIASRIEPMADPGGICVTQQVYDQIWNKLSVKMDELGQCQLKNVSAPVGVYRVALPKQRTGSTSGRTRTGRSSA